VLKYISIKSYISKHIRVPCMTTKCSLIHHVMYLKESKINNKFVVHITVYSDSINKA